MDKVPDTRIGILGGTFNPVHIGHLILGQSAIEAFELSKVLFIPCAEPPHKEKAGLLATEHRVAMLEMALEEDLRFEVCDIELKRGGRSYTIDTVRKLREIYPGTELYFIIGSDTLTELYLWKDINKLLKLCRLATFGRPGFDVGSIKAKDLALDPSWSDRLLDAVRTGGLVDVSSSDIRYRIAEGMSIRYLVPSVVEMYIAEHGLYRQ